MNGNIQKHHSGSPKFGFIKSEYQIPTAHFGNFNISTKLLNFLNYLKNLNHQILHVPNVISNVALNYMQHLF